MNKLICPICRDTLNKYITTNCGHNFHAECLNDWLEKHNNCPMCRTEDCTFGTTYKASILKYEIIVHMWADVLLLTIKKRINKT